MLTRKDKDQVKRYRMWAVMQAQDQMRADYEKRMQDCMGLHNEHALLRLRGFYRTCGNATMKAADELKLYPQG